MDGMQMARLARCQECEHWRLGARKFWRWPRCNADGAEGLELSDKVVKTGGCPLGRWEGLEPVKRPAGRPDFDAFLRRRNARAVGPVVDVALAHIPDAQGKADFLVDLVVAGALDRKAAEKRAVQEGLDLDAP
jgi:hypothetical protein